MITIIDYGLGNVLAFQNVFKRIHIPVQVARTRADLVDASKLILPGVGHFDHAMTLFNTSGLRDATTERVLGNGVPLIGICVGMQMLARRSEEGTMDGLSWVPGTVRRLDVSGLKHSTHLPHMGWNSVRPTQESKLFSGLSEDARFYFLHSYYFEPSSADSMIATADYGQSFACAVQNSNVYGVQFHPEKSHHWGSRLLQNFAEL